MQTQRLFDVLPKEERLWSVDHKNPACPLAQFVGNNAAVKKLSVIAYNALSRINHECRDLSLAIVGPASSGKTTLVRLFAKIIEIPLIEISPKSIETLDDLFEEIARVLEQEGVPLVEIDQGSYILPPCIIFIDEVHALKKSIVHGLLKATEHNDATLITENKKVINCCKTCWIIATTEAGLLFDAFRSRFNLMELSYLNKNQIARIVQNNFPEFDAKTCALIAHYNSKMPRKALEFARYMKLVHAMTPSSWENIARNVAKDEGVDEFGMHSCHLNILVALQKGPIARSRLVNYGGGRKAEELENFWMPWLLSDADNPALVTVGNKGYEITESGTEELDKRGLLG